MGSKQQPELLELHHELSKLSRTHLHRTTEVEMPDRLGAWARQAEIASFGICLEIMSQFVLFCNLEGRIASIF